VLEETQATKEDVFWDMIAFLVGGHESSAKTLTTALLVLKKHPEIEEKLRNEVNDVFPNEIEEITSDMLDKMSYLSCFVKEVLRFTPPALRSLGYKAYETVTLSNRIRIPKG